MAGLPPRPCSASPCLPVRGSQCSVREHAPTCTTAPPILMDTCVLSLFQKCAVTHSCVLGESIMHVTKPCRSDAYALCQHTQACVENVRGRDKRHRWGLNPKHGEKEGDRGGRKEQALVRERASERERDRASERERENAYEQEEWKKKVRSTTYCDS